MLEDKQDEKWSGPINGLVERKEKHVSRRLAQLEAIDNLFEVTKNLEMLYPILERASI